MATATTVRSAKKRNNREPCISVLKGGRTDKQRIPGPKRMIVMTYFSTTARRVVAVAAAAVAGLAISTAAYAATSSGTAATAAASIPRCTASDLGVWLAVGQGNGAAGTIYYPLEFTNLSHHTCYLYGYPGVSARDRNGHQLGSPADWGSLKGARIVNL